MTGDHVQWLVFPCLKESPKIPSTLLKTTCVAYLKHSSSSLSAYESISVPFFTNFLLCFAGDQSPCPAESTNWTPCRSYSVANVRVRVI